ncbi:MAG: PLP-dependent aminotransferase family protein [Spirochaetota bacterium]|nr:MAG: PLP-dependent aminotransferase family protein [Spirochaetota bacterium]
MDFTNRYSESALRLKSSKIRELFKLVNVPGLISMAGGMPDSGSFQFEEIKKIINSWSYETAKVALQYGTTRGHIPLLEEIGKWMEQKKMISMEGQDVLITTGSQQAITLISKLFLNPNDIVIVEIPSFIGAIASIYSYMGRIEGIRLDSDGMVIDDLVQKIDECHNRKLDVKFIYTIPNFNNPSGITLAQEKRRSLLDVSKEFGIPIVEDDPYGELYYYGEEEDYRPIKSMDIDGNVVYLGTFSKVLSPGLRVGWIVAESQLVAKLEIQKQSIDACTPTFSQVIAYEYMHQGYINTYISKMRGIYREKRDTMLGALEKNMPEGVTWTAPNGGFFVWLSLPEYLDAEDVFRSAIKKKVAFVTGDAFLPENYAKNFIRLCFSDLDLDRIKKGIDILADVIQKLL